MPFEIGERAIFRSLQWEVADSSSESVLELFGRSRENQDRSARVVLALTRCRRGVVSQPQSNESPEAILPGR
jgi:hypothetical protein